ncbi:VacJ family lipoprotein [Chitinimonas arctica]|uniref:VacJ family lipoprotein n=1 Tax=Chitinimonas arctica TaxID=2594795 RepID=A0A516SEC5_9NEIS|nr:VacJ family lipoprotein [Chitinimonas arctica]QDQ26501.1 VacJ family lipoprotein [Chitinimonas arctica]
MRHRLPLLLSPLLLAACATPTNHYDPLEPINRKVYAFNSALDKAVLKPVAKGYVAITPKPIRAGVANFFGNLQDVYIGAANLLQGNWRDAASDGTRVVFNSTFGLLGLIDIASQAGLEKHDEDFGQVLGHWGMGSGPYLVVPFLGPKTLRDTADWAGSYALDPVRAIQDDQAATGLNLLRMVNLRTELLAADSVVQAASFGDEYGFVRDSYLQRRYNMVWNGNPPKPLPLGDGDEEEIDVKDLDFSTTPKPAAEASGAGAPEAPAPVAAEPPAANPVAAPAPAVEPPATAILSDPPPQ